LGGGHRFRASKKADLTKNWISLARLGFGFENNAVMDHAVGGIVGATTANDAEATATGASGIFDFAGKVVEGL